MEEAAVLPWQCGQRDVGTAAFSSTPQLAESQREGLGPGQGRGTGHGQPLCPGPGSASTCFAFRKPWAFMYEKNSIY